MGKILALLGMLNPLEILLAVFGVLVSAFGLKQVVGRSRAEKAKDKQDAQIAQDRATGEQEVQDANQARATTTRDLNAHPDQLRADDGFKRKL